MFKRRRKTPHLTLTDDEAQVIRQVIAEYLELLDDDRPLDDPVIARLFPSASFDDAQVEQTFRDMVQEDLGEHKRQMATTVMETLGPGGSVDRPLDAEQTTAWLTLLTDLRLAIGVRLNVTEEMMELTPDPRDPEQWPLAVMHYLGMLQESLVRVAPLDAP